MIEIAWDEHLQRLALEDEEDLTPRDFRLPREQEELRRLVYGGRLCILCLPQTREERLYPANVVTELVGLRAVVAEREDASPPRPPYAMSVEEEEETVDLPIHIRGSHLNLADTPQPRGFLRVTDHIVPPPPIPAGASGRLELARWITHPEHPLTARVMANRIWHWHFGRGLVDTPSNFGTTGSAPTNVELLDWLARRFVESGWSMKTLHREILLSSTYRLSTDYSEVNAAVDQSNLLHWRMNRRRLGFEAMRDSMLSVAGQLECRAGGRPTEQRPDDSTNRRRTMYLFVDREKLPDLFRVFDFPCPDISAPGRSRTTVPQQSLFLLNSPFVIAQAEATVQHLDRNNDEAEQGICQLYRQVLGREPAIDELALAKRYVVDRAQPKVSSSGKPLAANPWAELAQALLLSNEFLFVD